MKKIIGLLGLLTSLQTEAKLNGPTSGDYVVCHEKGNQLFYIQAYFGKEIGKSTYWWETVYDADFTTLTGPRLEGQKYGIEIKEQLISTRVQSGSSYSAQIPDGSEFSMKYFFDGLVEYPEAKLKFEAQITTLKGYVIYFRCEKKQ